MESKPSVQICPWCMTEITWDEEIGPESHCPHCDNELGGYRSIGVNLERDDEGVRDAEVEAEPDDWSEEEEDAGRPNPSWDEGYLPTDRGMLAADGMIRRIVDEQDEAPECPVCREYMLEAGVQQMGGAGFRPTAHQPLGKPILPETFALVWYVCPSCFHASSVLSLADRKAMLDRMSEQD